jgi:EAL domain-containing protein (putative c-di-GMP-specific phosphodiesterase class I)
MALIGTNSQITVIAEGLEDLADVPILRKLGCQQVQGYAFSRPISLCNLLEFQVKQPEEAVANIV